MGYGVEALLQLRLLRLHRAHDTTLYTVSTTTLAVNLSPGRERCLRLKRVQIGSRGPVFHGTSRWVRNS
jgi:hypothetical protein